MLKYFCTLAFIICSISCQAIELSSEETIALEQFFRVLIEKSEGGYVLNNNKPICVQGYYKEDYFQNEHEQHANSVCLREGAAKWKNLKLNDKNSNIIIHVYNNEDELVKNSIHILFINKKLFHETVQNNLPLFQYVLGPDITSQTLLIKLTDPNETFHSTLKNDKVLIGILLGFGPQNSLYISRIENLHEALLSPEQPPLKSKLSKIEEAPFELRQQFLLNEGMSDQKISIPSPGNLSLLEELRELNNKIEISSPKLSKEYPQFIFGRLKEHKESDKLVNSLEMSQLQIRMLLNSNNFLKDVLSLMYPGEEIIIHPASKPLLSFSPVECSQFTNLVAANIWNVLKGNSMDYQQSFMAGMQDADAGEPNKIGFADTFNYERLKTLRKIKGNLTQADSFFSQLGENPRNICVMPFKLYYQIKEEGSGPILTDQTKVKVKYIIRTPNDKVILSDNWSDNQANWINLQEVIQGFAWGMKGMKIGEVREIYIHPSLGYGIYTTFDKGIYLRALVKLSNIDNTQSESEKLAELTPLDFESEIDANIDSIYAEEEKRAGYLRGYQVWQHYKKGQFCSLPDVLFKITSLQKNNEDSGIHSKESQDLINRLHWNIYQTK